MFLPSPIELESWCLLNVSVDWERQDGVDLVGPTASVGPDGVQDIHLHLSSLKTSINGYNATLLSILVQGPSGFECEYEYQNNTVPSGWANAEFFYPATNPTDHSQGDLFINPTVDSAVNGSSTGTPTTLQNGNVLNLTVTYSAAGSTFMDTGSTPISNLANPPLTMTPNTTPGNVVMNSFSVSWSNFANNGQDGTHAQGWVHLSVTGLGGKAITSATLSDQEGSQWLSTDTTNHEPLFVQEAQGNASADIYFPPVRDETVCVAGVSVSTDMTLRLTFTGDTHQYVIQFAGGPWKPSLLANPLNGNSWSTPVSTASTLSSLLETPTGGTEYDTITLAANTTITLTQPLEINHSVRIIGQGATLKFQASWSSSTPGAIYLNPSTGYSSDYIIDFENFSIGFDTSFHNTWYDPENEQNGPHAVVMLAGGNASPVVVTLSGMSITGPPALDPTPPGSPPSGYTYIGEEATPLVLTNAAYGWTQASGTITGCTFQGGTIKLSGGPWDVSGNVHSGALANTYAVGAFSVESPHDVTFDNNHVSQSVASGYEARLINFHNATFNDNVFNNTFSGGFLGNQITYSTASNQYVSADTGAPEVILVENYGVFYEGPAGAISNDGWILTLPKPSSSINSRAPMTQDTGHGLIVSIVNTQNSNGSANPLAGEWFPIAQQISTSPPTFLMRSPLPAGSYIISVTSGSIGDQYSWNTINVAGTSSTGIDLPGNQFGTQIVHNTFIGGGAYVFPYTGTGILVQAYQTDPTPNPAVPTTQNPYPLPGEWTRAPVLGVTIEYNTIENSPGGMIIKVRHGSDINATTGRLYLTATVEYNIIEWTQSWLSSWATSTRNGLSAMFYGILNGNNNPANAPSDNSRPPTITVGDGFSAGVRTPSTVLGPSGSPNGPLGYVDPHELSLTLQGNSASILSSTGALQIQAEPTGQVYEGVINGVVSPTSAFPYNQPNYQVAGNPPYYAPYDADNLNINGSPVSNPSLSAVALNQDGADVVRLGTNSGSDGIQDEHIRLYGLNPTLSVTKVTLESSNPDVYYEYNAPFGSNNTDGAWRAELVRQGLAPVGDLYFELNQGASPSDQFTVTVTYSTGPPQSTTFTGVSVSNPNLPMPTFSATSLNQDGVDLVGQGTGAGPDGNQDVDIELNGLNTALDITKVGIGTTSGSIYDEYNAPFGSNNTDGWWRAELVRQARSPVGDLYFQLNQSMSPSTQFTVTVTYSDGSTQSITLSGISVSNPLLPDGQIANPNLPMPSLSAVPLNQDGIDLVGPDVDSEPDGTQDVDIQLVGLNTSLAVTKVGISSSNPNIYDEYNAPFGSNNTDGWWRAELVRQALAPVADLYFQLNQGVTPSDQFTVTVTYSTGPPQSVTFTGVTVSNPFLGDGMATNGVALIAAPSRRLPIPGGAAATSGRSTSIASGVSQPPSVQETSRSNGLALRSSGPAPAQTVPLLSSSGSEGPLDPFSSLEGTVGPLVGPDLGTRAIATTRPSAKSSPMIADRPVFSRLASRAPRPAQKSRPERLPFAL